MVIEWLIGAVVYLSCRTAVQLFAMAAMDDRIMRRGIISSCQSASTMYLDLCFLKIFPENTLKYT